MLKQGGTSSCLAINLHIVRFTWMKLLTYPFSHYFSAFFQSKKIPTFIFGYFFASISYHTMPTSYIYSRKTWEARSKESRASEHVEPPAQGISGALSNLSENTYMLNRDQGQKKSNVVATVKEPQKNPGLVLLSTVSTQITERQQQDSAPQQKPEEGSKNMMDLERKANQHLGGNIVMDTNAQFDSHSQSKISWHNDAHHYSHRRNMMERM